MSAPKLTVASSGYGGRGYKNPWTGEVVPGVTTVGGAVQKDGLIQWSVDQVAAYASVIAEELAEREPEKRYNMLRYYHARAKESTFDDPYADLTNAHTGVLDDLSNLGTAVHEWVEADLNGWIEPEIYRAEQEAMIVAYLEWKADQDIEVHATEATVFGSGYAGTADGFLKINGTNTLMDTKTSRKVHETHISQLAALGAADLMAREVSEGTEGAVGFKPRKADKGFSSWWVKDVPPPIQQYAVLQIRPDEYDNYGVFKPAFCQLHIIPQEKIDAGWEIFQGALQIRRAQRSLKQLEKEEKNG